VYEALSYQGVGRERVAVDIEGVIALTDADKHMSPHSELTVSPPASAGAGHALGGGGHAGGKPKACAPAKEKAAGQKSESECKFERLALKAPEGLRALVKRYVLA
jgi:hypothetical protein